MDLNSSATWNHKKISSSTRAIALCLQITQLQQPIGCIHMLKEQYLLVLC